MTSSAQAPVYGSTQLGSNNINNSAFAVSPYHPITGLSAVQQSSREFQQQQQQQQQQRQHHYGNIFTASMLPGAAATVLQQMPNASSAASFTTVCLPIMFNPHQQGQTPGSSGVFMTRLPLHNSFPVVTSTTSTTETTRNTFNGRHHHHNHHHQNNHQAPVKTAVQQPQQAFPTYNLSNSIFQHHQNGGMQLIIQNHVSGSPVSTNASTAQHTPSQPATDIQTEQLTAAPEMVTTLKTSNRSASPNVVVKSAPRVQSKTGRASKHSAADNSVQLQNICLLCRLSFADENALLLHNRSHHPNLKQQFYSSHNNNNNNHHANKQNSTHHHRPSSKRRQTDLLPLPAGTPENNSKPVVVPNNHHQPPEHFCQYCAEASGEERGVRSFPTASALHAHIQTAHNPNKPHRCTLCEAVAFAKEKDLAVHMQRHTGVRPHLCSLCNKAFLKKCDLLRHQQIHANRRLFKCERCGRAFNDKSNLRGHFKRRHPD